jgi:ketosteroid isomerase-like protein
MNPLYCVPMKRRSASLLILISLVSAHAYASPAETAEAEVRNALADFIQAFDNLDWDRFRAAFSDDATAFYPREFSHRADGRQEFEKAFRNVFDRIRAGRTQAPYMDIQPRDLHLQIAGNVAIVSFHLDDRPGFLNRRTIVLQKQTSGWKIIHLHASEVAMSAQ